MPTLPLPVRPAAPPAPPAAATPSAPPADEPDLEPPRPAGRPQPVTDRTAATGSTGERFPAVVADLTGLYGPHGRLAVLPDSLDHVGHLAAAAITVSPSWGGGEPAQIWIGDDLRARLDLPADLPESAQPHPWVERALAEGWQIGRGGHTAELRPWLRVWREGESGCRVSIVGWQDTPLTADRPASQTLADRLCRYAELLTIPWRNSAGVTGLELLRVVRWRARQRSGSRAAVVRTSIPLPDPAFTPGAEIDVHQWGRLPGPDEPGEWLHVYDRSAAYLAAANGAVVGLDVEPDHVDAPDFDPRRAGYWNIRVPGWEHARLPHPLGRPVRAGGSRWVTTPTVRLLHELDLAPHIEEAYLWPRAVSTRYLTQWYELLRDARAAAQQVADADPWLLAAVKATYTHGVGQMGAGARKPGKGQAADYPLWRPDWRHTIIATARMTFLHHLLQIGEGTGRWPVLADIDAVGYVSADPDPVRAWPGAAAGKELAAGPGRFHVTGSIRVTDVTGDLEKGRISRILERLP